jgi:ABC-type nitrate/sulfonate/bicarbonate transport system permease component
VKPADARSTAIALGLVTVFLLAWELAVRWLDVPVYLLPAPSRVLLTLGQNGPAYLQGSLLTLGEALAGLVIGVLAGLLIAVLVVFLPGFEGGVMTLAILAKSTPMVAIAPLLTLWLGFGVLPKIIITALLTFVPVLVNLLSGFGRVDPALLDLFRSWRAGRWQIFTALRVPSALPYLFAALKISAPLALIGAVVAEWTGASGGLGRTMWLAYSNLNLPFLFAAIFILAAAGMALYQALSFLERRALFWLPSSPTD